MLHKFDPPFHSVFFYDPVPQYDPTVEGRPALLDVPRVYEGEDHDKRVERLRLFVLQWAKEDAARDADAPKGRGRPRVHKALPGETETERRRRIGRETYARWKQRHGVRTSRVVSEEALHALANWAWWQGCEAGRGDGEPPTVEAVLAQLETARTARTA